MKKNVWVFFVLGGIVLAEGIRIYAAQSANSDLSAVAWAKEDVVINEIGGYATSTHEWIEVWNRGSEPVDLTGWKFLETNVKHGVTSKVGDALLAPGEYGAIVQDDVQFVRDNPDFVGSVFDSSWGSLSESGEEIGLIDDGGVEIEKFTYISFSNFSLERVNPFLNDYTGNNWRERASGSSIGVVNSVYFVTSTTSTTTPNDTVTPTTTEEVATESASSTSNNTKTASTTLAAERWEWTHINEIFPHPDTAGDEWVELFNASTTAVDVTGGILCDGRETTCTIAKLEGSIPPRGFLVVSLSSSYLNNNGDTVILRNELGSEVERVTYSGELVPNSNESLARFVNTDVSFNVTTVPTPGAENVLQAPVVPEPKTVVTSGGGGSSNAGSSSAINQMTITNKTTTSTTKTKVVEPPKTTIAWSVEVPAFALLNELVHFSAETSADPRGGELFMGWSFDDKTTLDGGWVEHAFTTTGTKHVYIFATSTAGTTGTYSITIPVLARAFETSVVLSEVYASAATGESEFVELANTSAFDKDISGWGVIVGNDKFILPASTTIPALGYRVLYRTATKLVLRNTGGLITLLTNKNEAADSVVVPKTASGKTFARNADVWATTLEATPGFTNIFSEVLGEKIVAEEKPQPKTKSTTTSKSIIVVTTLADLKELSSNQAVVVSGVVTVLPGVFGSQTFYITDESGSAEMYSSKKNFPNLKMGDKVRVSGSIGSGASVERIKIKTASDVSVVGTASTTPNAVNLNLVDEEMVGSVVEIKGEITQVKKGVFYLDDNTDEIAVAIKPGTRISVVPKVGNAATVVGMFMRGKSGLELWPRAIEDIVLTSSKIKNTPTTVPISRTNVPYPAVGVVGGGLVIAVWKWRETLVGLVTKVLRRG